MADLGAAYADARMRATAWLRTLEPAQLDLVVPACPEWTLHDMFARHIGMIDDVAHNRWRMLEAGAEAWHDPAMARLRDELAREKITARKGRSLEELISEWETLSAFLQPILSGESTWATEPPPFTDMTCVIDLGTHLQDARGALGQPGDREIAASRLGLVFYVGWFGLRVVDTAMPAISIRAGQSEWTLGVGEAQASVGGTEWEMWRALSGRRTRDEVLALDWTGDVERYLPIVSPYGLRDTPLAE